MKITQFDETLASRKEFQYPRQRSLKKVFQTRVGSISTGDPNYLRRRAEFFEQPHKVSILCHYNYGLLLCGKEDVPSVSSLNPISRNATAEMPNVWAIYRASAGES